MTGPAWSTSNDPSKTERRWKARWSRGDRRSWLQATAPSSVRWRAGASRAPLPGQRQAGRKAVADRGQRQERHAGGGQLDAQRQPVDAARRSRRRPRRPGPGPSPGGRRAPARRRAAARPSPRRWTPSGAIGISCSPVTRSGARLVTTNRDRGETRTSSATAAAASRTCSKLSRTSSIERSARNAGSVSTADLDVPSNRPIVRATSALTSAGSSIVASGTNHAPSAYSASTARAASVATLVLPMPPAPVMVTSRASSSSARERLDLVVAPDEGRRAAARGCRPSSGRPGPAGTRPAARERRAGTAARAGDVLEDEQAEVAGGRAGRQVVGGELVGRAGEDDLAAVPDGRDAGGPADLDPAVVVARAVGLAAVDAHPDADGRRPRARRGPGASAGRRPRRRPRRRLPERGEHGVALGPDDGPAMGVDGRPDQRDVRGVDVVPARRRAPG